jgi:hypothetical protein
MYMYAADVLQTRIGPLLGITPSMHAAVLAWVHFRQYVLTQEPQLLAETRQLLYKLAAMSDGPEAGGLCRLVGVGLLCVNCSLTVSLSIQPASKADGA